MSKAKFLAELDKKSFRRRKDSAKSLKHLYTPKFTGQYTNSELALKMAVSRTSRISVFQFAIKTLFGFHTYLLKSYNSYIVPFLSGKSYTINGGGEVHKRSFHLLQLLVW